MSRALVYGLAVAGEATVRALLAHGVEVVVADDEVTPARHAAAAGLGVELLGRPSDEELSRLVSSVDLVCPAPGVPEEHLVVATAQALGTPVLSEIELAYRWEQERAGGPRPIVAITGTDGKTTTTLLAVEMLRAAGLRSIDAGNTDTPLVDALALDLDAYVVECTSFRLAWTPTFRADAAVWLNLAPDHLNWHRSMETYESAKAQIFANQSADDVAIGFLDDPAVMGQLAHAPGRQVTFGTTTAADYHAADGYLRGPRGPIARIDSMRRRLPHDITNALAAAAAVLECGLADEAAVADALARFSHPPHRLEEVGTWDGIAWFNDSKATTPHAAAAAVRSFDRLILIAGGYDKGVDLSPMAEDQSRVTAVLAIGATSDAVAAAFSGVAHVEVLSDLVDAVARATEIAQAGDTVLLSPGCASFDHYRGFEERGEHFRSLVTNHYLHASAQRRGVNE